MEAACFQAPRNLEIIKTPIPQITDDQVLIKGKLSPILQRTLKSELWQKCPAAAYAAPIITWRRSAKKIYKIYNLTDEEATLVEPASCAIHGLDKLNAPAGIEALVVGAGPTGLILAQLLKLNGASKVVIAANKSIKTRVAQELDCGDEYIELDRDNPEPQWAELRKTHPYGFDVVVEATGSEKIANDAINYVRRGGTLMIYGVYSNDALVHWPPSKIFGDEIRIVGSFAQTHCFPRAVEYLDGGKIRVKGMVTDTFAVKDYQKALDKMNSKDAVKVAVKPTL
ncbi:N-terminal acetyltransferase A complex catalytic subunit ard1 [Tephrocybe rancida]|nr:N-terminal acetyltransferase A complex catalytic subunit ard1 [Tephrocybe rancida]